MTAINTIVLPNRIHIITDGAMYDEAGLLNAIAGKAVAIPSYPGIVATRGAAMGAAIFATMFPMYCPTFDSLIERIEDVYPEIHEGIASRWLGGHDVGQMFVAGWSNERQRCELYFISGNDYHLHDAEGEEGVMSSIRPEVGKLQRITTATTLPASRPGDDEKGWLRPPRSDADADRDIDDYALTLLQLQRSHDHVGGYDGMPAVQIGGAAFVTTLTKEGVTSRCIHRWEEDEIGEFITPAEIDWQAWRHRRSGPESVVNVDGLSRLQRERMLKKAKKGTLR